MSAPKSFRDVICEHGDKPKSLGKFHPSTVSVYSPECTTKAGVPKFHAGPGAKTLKTRK